MARTHVRRRRTISVIAAIGLAGLLSGPVAHAVGIYDGGRGARTHVVRPGETLWSIAVRFEPARDPRIVVATIADANGVDAGSLTPGQELVIPLAG